MSLESRLQAIWYGGQSPGAMLVGLSWLYGKVVAIRRWLYRNGLFRRQRLPVPVLVVGNRVAGGTGKTPLVLALLAHFQSRGWRPGVVSRGYGRTAGGLVMVDAGTSPDRAGDEPALIARNSGAPVAVCTRRARAGRALVDLGCDLIVSDDGLQHLALARDLEIEVIDGQRGYGNARLLPAGPLREPTPWDFQGLRVVNGDSLQASDWPMRLESGHARPLAGGTPAPVSAFAGRRVHAVAGIGHPQRFFGGLRGQGIEVLEHAFPDHHRYSAQDLRFAEDLPILMTAKDAVKCRGIAPPSSFQVDVSARLPEAFFMEVERRLGIAGHD